MSKKNCWNLNDSIEKLFSREQRLLMESFGECANSIGQEIDVSTKALEECRIIAAGVVREHGDHYLPLFERLHGELKARRSKSDLLRQALDYAPSEEQKP